MLEKISWDAVRWAALSSCQWGKWTHWKQLIAYLKCLLQNLLWNILGNDHIAFRTNYIGLGTPKIVVLSFCIQFVTYCPKVTHTRKSHSVVRYWTECVPASTQPTRLKRWSFVQFFLTCRIYRKVSKVHKINGYLNLESSGLTRSCVSAEPCFCRRCGWIKGFGY